MNEKPHIRDVIAQNVKKYRKMRNLTQEQLAELADISNTYIANIECGKTWVSDKTLEKISIGLHVDTYLLFIPITDEKTCADTRGNIQQTANYVSMRQEELCNYIKSYFSETFMQVQKIRTPN